MRPAHPPHGCVSLWDRNPGLEPARAILSGPFLRDLVNGSADGTRPRRHPRSPDQPRLAAPRRRGGDDRPAPAPRHPSAARLADPPRQRALRRRRDRLPGADAAAFRRDGADHRRPARAAGARQGHQPARPEPRRPRAAHRERDAGAQVDEGARPSDRPRRPRARSRIHHGALVAGRRLEVARRRPLRPRAARAGPARCRAERPRRARRCSPRRAQLRHRHHGHDPGPGEIGPLGQRARARLHGGKRGGASRIPPAAPARRSPPVSRSCAAASATPRTGSSSSGPRTTSSAPAGGSSASSS